MESTHKTDKDSNDIPKPNDEEQGTYFVVDHIFELQVIVYAFSGANKENGDKAKAVPQAAWDKAAECVNGLGQTGNKVKNVAQKVCTSSQSFSYPTYFPLDLHSPVQAKPSRVFSADRIFPFQRLPRTLQASATASTP